MLSKLRHSGTVIRPSSEPEQKELTSRLNALFGVDLAGLRFVPGGTLGVCFKADLNGQPRFFKTHAIPSGRCTLQRESAFLKATAAKQTDPRLLHVADGGAERVWLHTRQLEPCRPLSPQEVLALIAGYETVLERHPELASVVPASDSISQLLSEAESALDFMIRNSLLSPFVINAAHSKIDRLKLVCADLPLQLCHGDLGPANIMTGDGSLVALDWEDAFWGIAGYDYLYWLTFFGNRKWLSTDAFGHTTLDRSTEIGLMLIILLLKSWISVLNGSYLQNTLTIDNRLLEVINLE